MSDGEPSGDNYRARSRRISRGWCWHKVEAALRAAGQEVVSVDFPGHAPGSNDEPVGLYGDAAHLQKVLNGIANAVLLVGHSYGGAVITEAAAGHPAVIRLVYLCAAMPDEGESLATAVPPGESSPVTDSPGGQLMIPSDDGITMHLDPSTAPSIYYQDCAGSDVEYALTRLSRQTVASVMQPVRNVAWRTIPATYIVCEQDLALSPDTQRAYATRAEQVFAIPAGHSGFLSQPELIASILIEQ
jgi:pimeloyl-ACP methyl ester carboxylesterase